MEQQIGMKIDDDSIEELLEVWDDLAQQVKQLKVTEMVLRKDLVAFLAPDGVPGVHSTTLINITAKATLKLTHKFDTVILDEKEKDLSQLERDAIKYNPTLSLTNYKKIPEAMRELLDEMLIVTPAAPTLEIKYRTPEDDDE